MADEFREKVKCDNCIYAWWSQKAESLTCHRFPPVLIRFPNYTGNLVGEYEFPVVGDEAFCGEFRSLASAEENIFGNFVHAAREYRSAK